jgi:hypothetical protein
MPTVGSHLPAGVVRLLYGAVECFFHSLSYLASVTLPVNLSGEVALLSYSVEGVGPKPNPTTSQNLTYLLTYSKFDSCRISLPFSRQRTVPSSQHRFLSSTESFVARSGQTTCRPRFSTVLQSSTRVPPAERHDSTRRKTGPVGSWSRGKFLMFAPKPLQSI